MPPQSLMSRKMIEILPIFAAFSLGWGLCRLLNANEAKKAFFDAYDIGYTQACDDYIADHNAEDAQ